MRILVISNYYPPSDYGGGYMQLCEEVVSGLSGKGHQITVLTSTYCNGDHIHHPYPVHRLLTINPDWRNVRPAAYQFFVGRHQQERRDVGHLCNMVREFHPDVIFVWHTAGLTRLLLREAEGLPGVVVAYYFADYLLELPDEYIVYWQSPPVHWAARAIKPSLSKLALRALEREGKPFSLKCEHAICVSDYVRRRLMSQGLIAESAVVINNGVDLACFSPKADSRRRFSSGALRCLVAGRVVADKGIHTVIDALGLLKSEGLSDNIVLTVLGDGPPNYREYLDERVSLHHLADTVEFRSPVPRDQMPQILADHDVLILPSEYDEPLARSAQEAMAMELLVVGTTTGGSGEILVDGVNGLAFAAGDAGDLASQLRSLLESPLEQKQKLAKSGRRTVVESFDISLTVNNIDQHLLRLCRDIKGI